MRDEHLRFSPALASCVLGSLGLMLFFLPVLGIPLGALGLLLATGSGVWAWFSSAASFRWSVVGIIVCSVALGADLALMNGPLDFAFNYRVVPSWQRPANVPYVSPPARPQP